MSGILKRFLPLVSLVLAVSMVAALSASFGMAAAKNTDTALAETGTSMTATAGEDPDIQWFKDQSTKEKANTKKTKWYAFVLNIRGNK